MYDAAVSSKQFARCVSSSERCRLSTLILEMTYLVRPFCRKLDVRTYNSIVNTLVTDVGALKTCRSAPAAGLPVIAIAVSPGTTRRLSHVSHRGGLPCRLASRTSWLQALRRSADVCLDPLRGRRLTLTVACSRLVEAQFGFRQRCALILTWM